MTHTPLNPVRLTPSPDPPPKSSTPPLSSRRFLPLRGDEAAKIRAFKQALGLEDEDAAPAHLDVARRLYRSGFETKDRTQQFEQRKVGAAALVAAAQQLCWQ